MNVKTSRRNLFTTIVLILLIVNVVISIHILRAADKQAAMWAASSESGGELRIRGDRGEILGACPLQYTDVDADIVGHITRVRVRQTFSNPLDHKIEAVYVFPLPQDAAVDEMTMTIGNRRIVGKVKPKEEARKTYEAAKAAGHVASLLDQDRPNIFTQSVANIEPGAQVVIEISYAETLKYADGVFEFVFPMVVGPRYVPGGRPADASKINPPIAPPATRAGHDIRMTVRIDGGADLFDIKSDLHEINVHQSVPGQAVVNLRNEGEIPNRDFILRYRTATEAINDSFFVHPFPGGAYFTLILQPPRRVTADQARPKEIIFVIDRSGSQEGFPLEKAKETMRQCIVSMNPRDTFNLISFSDDTTQLFDHPQSNTAPNREQALRYLDSIQAGGGTEMSEAILKALKRPADRDRLRIVCFMTDGFVENDFEIIEAVRKNAGNARVFSFGIGNSVNRFLLDGLAHAGRGEVEYVTLEKDGSGAAARFHERIQSPVLTDIQIDWGKLNVSEVYPRQMPDLFSDKPILIHGLVKGNLEGVITLHGFTAQGLFTRRIPVHSPDAQEPHDALASLWARAKVKDLMMQDMAGLQSGQMRDDLKKAITDLGVRFRLMTQFTSFIAVEEQRKTQPGQLTPISVPTDKPDGVSDSLVGGSPTMMAQARAGDPLLRVQAPPDAAQVIALLPGGKVKRLLFDLDRNEWLARFDIPTYAQEGDYFVQVVIVRKDGTRKTLLLRYRVDSTPPTGVAQKHLNAYQTLNLELDASEDTARVAALLPWGERVNMSPATVQGKRFSAQTRVPRSYRGKAIPVTFVLTDRAHNRTTITVEE